MQRMKVAVVQVCGGENIEHNLARACEIVREARADGAELICLPENVGFVRITEKRNFGETLDGRVVTTFANLAREIGAAILIGGHLPRLVLPLLVVTASSQVRLPARQ